MDMMKIEGTPEICRYRCSILIKDVGRVEYLGVVALPPSEKNSRPNWNTSPD
jgi:hypothetical protein